MNPEESRASKSASAPDQVEDPGVTYDAWKAIALAFPDVVESTSYGTPALKVRGKLMARLKEDDETVVVRTTWEERERLMVLHPDIFSVTDHYRAYPWVLMRLSAATNDIAARVLEEARQCLSRSRTKKSKRL